VVSGVFVTKEADAVGDKGVSGDITAVDIQTLLWAFLSMSLKCAFFINEAIFLVKAKLVLGQLYPGVRLSGFLNYEMSD
jgi:hypothetical protein